MVRFRRRLYPRLSYLQVILLVSYRRRIELDAPLECTLQIEKHYLGRCVEKYSSFPARTLLPIIVGTRGKTTLVGALVRMVCLVEDDEHRRPAYTKVKRTSLSSSIVVSTSSTTILASVVLVEIEPFCVL